MVLCFVSAEGEQVRSSLVKAPADAVQNVWQTRLSFEC